MKDLPMLILRLVWSYVGLAAAWVFCVSAKAILAVVAILKKAIE